MLHQVKGRLVVWICFTYPFRQLQLIVEVLACSHKVEQTDKTQAEQEPALSARSLGIFTVIQPGSPQPRQTDEASDRIWLRSHGKLIEALESRKFHRGG